MEMMNDEQLKRELPFDHYGRYALIREIIDANRPGAQRFRILDVGGRGNLLRMFLPDDEVFYLDPHLAPDDPAAKDNNYIDGDGCDIPVEDGGFDFVVSADVFEHVSPSDRETFLKENLRAARLGVVLAAPFYSRETELAESFVNETYRIISRGEDHPWLLEHMENGLPRDEELEGYIRATGYGFQKIPNNDILLWEILICSNFIALDAPEESKNFNYFCNDKLHPYDHGAASYRLVYFVKKDAALLDLELTASQIDTGLKLEAVKGTYGLLCHIHIRNKDRISQLEKEKHEQALLLAKKKDAIRSLEHDYSELMREVNRMRSTFSWKATTPLRGLRVLSLKALDMVREKKRRAG